MFSQDGRKMHSLLFRFCKVLDLQLAKTLFIYMIHNSGLESITYDCNYPNPDMYTHLNFILVIFRATCFAIYKKLIPCFTFRLNRGMGLFY